ncbi:MAG: single-stranded DNA-binding protein [Clostridiales Family XIII bacterium]|jgi:single-strand DNA-binding protein|nr:single-stranded DNA-binding protein [Clostridiales Family XIII bacterium]
MNQVILIGRLTRDPEVRYTADQMAIASFTLAVDRPFTAGKEKQTDFPRITVFGKQAEICERYLAKGRLTAVQGRIRTGSYKNKDGTTVYTTEVTADRVEFLEWGDRTERQGGGFDRGDSLFGGAGSGAGTGFGAGEGAGAGPDASRSAEVPDGFTALEDDDDIPF